MKHSKFNLPNQEKYSKFTIQKTFMKEENGN